MSSSIFKGSLLATTVIAGALWGAPAFAQAAPVAPPATLDEEEAAPTPDAAPEANAEAAAADPAAATNQDAVVVTGSRIRRPNLDSVIPITSIAGEQFFQQGQTNVGDTLNDLPQLRSTFAQQNPGLGIGIAGLNLLDLRGLGTARTLVVVNGRRHVPADILNNAVSPDVNTIPNDLIERVDIVTGSNSAAYGSDAIAGVVNFILRKNFDGFQVRGQASVAQESLTGNQYVSAMFGKNLLDNRANITLHGEYARQDRIFGSDIPKFRSVDAFGIIDVDPVGLDNGSDASPDRTFFRDIRSASINRFGLIPITQPANIAGCGTGLAQTNGPGSSTPTPGLAPSATGLPYNCTFVFDRAGNLVPQTGTRYGSGIIGGIRGGNGQTGREDQLLSVIPFSKRLNFNLLAHFAISDAFEPFIEAKWNRVSARGSNAGPSFIQGTFGQFDIRERVRLDNPFLDSSERNTIANAILASGCNTSLTAPCSVPGVGSSFNRSTFGGQGTGGPLNAADIAAINAGTYRFVLARHLADSGIRDEEFQRDTYRVVTGIRGGFNTDWNYELSVNYGKFKEDTTTYGYLNRQRFLLSLDAGRNPATGQIQCRAQFDPAARTAFAGQSANLEADIAACIPYNPFGGFDNAAAANYFVYNATNKASLSQLDLLGFVGGDLSQLFELPGGPVRFVVGGEYRREKARYDNDDFIEAGATNAVKIGNFDPKTFKVKEAFGEIEVPLLKDFVIADELTLNAAGRISGYGGAIGTVKTWNVGGQYAPIRDLRFRANLGKAVRAPNVSETGFPQVPNFAPGFQDPCSPAQIGNNPNRAANCAADLGGLLGSVPTFVYSLPIISGSNPDLLPESSKSLTIGGVAQPRFIPGLSLSVDYWRIKVKDVIVSLSAQSIANNCYDQPSLDNPFCGLFTRFTGPGVGPLGENPGAILGNSLVSAGVNFAQRVRRGVDTNINYRTRLGAARLDTQVIYVRTLQSSNYENPSLPEFENRILGEVGDPKNELRWDTDVGIGNATFGYRLHYIGPMELSAYEDVNELSSACSTTACPPNNLDFADVRKVPRVFYHDIRAEYHIKNSNFGGDYTVYGGIDNVLNKYPPLGSTGTGAGPGLIGNAGIYDVRGRTFYLGAKARF